MNIKENIKSIIRNTYNIIYKVFIEKKMKENCRNS